MALTTARGVGRYYVVLKDQDGEQVAMFDNWVSLDYGKTVNGLYYYVLSFADDGDERFELFELDGQIEVYRSIPDIVDWYLDFEGFHRRSVYSTQKDGVKVFTSSGVGYNDLLARTVIAFKAGTIRADKSETPSETAMKEYVEENCGATSDVTSVGRLNYDDDAGEFLYNATLPGLTVEADSGAGEDWSGSRAYENLLDVLQDIANYSGIDFEVIGNGDAEFLFKTYESQLGSDRSVAGLDASSGLNDAGNAPVIFSVPFGNVQDVVYDNDRTSEINAVVVMGKGEGSTRTTETRYDGISMEDSPWNRRETARQHSSYDDDYETYMLNTYGDEVLQDMEAKELFTFTPMQQDGAMYGSDYFFGDTVTARYGSNQYNKRIISIKISVSKEKEAITLEFGDIPPIE